MHTIVDLSDPNTIVIGSLILAGVVVFVRGSLVAHAHGLTPLTRMGKGNWEFGSSWATTLTTAGAFLSTLLGATSTLFASAAGAITTAPGTPGPVPPATATPVAPLTSASTSPSSSSSISPTWTALNLLFAFIVLIAPLLYNAIRKEEAVKSANIHQSEQAQTDQFQYLGYFGVFLVASFLVLWGVTGELLTVASIFETPGMRGATPIVKGVLDVAVFIAIVLSYVYLWLGIDRIVSEQLAAPAAADAATYHLSSLRVQQQAGDDLERKRRDWTFF